MANCGLLIYFSLRFCHIKVIAQRVGKLHDLFVADALPLQLGRQVGNAVGPAIFVM